MSRTVSKQVDIKLYGENGKTFKMNVSLLAKSPPPGGSRFGVFQTDVDNFVNDMLALKVDGRKFRTKFLVSSSSASYLAENFAWTILSNKERKELTNTMTYAKPTTQHWLRFAKEIIQNRKFEFWIDRAFTQALWQFIIALPAMNIKGSTAQAKNNSVLTLVYINATRMIFMKLLGPDHYIFLHKNFHMKVFVL